MNNTIFCSKRNISCFTVGKDYDVINGVIVDDNGKVWDNEGAGFYSYREVNDFFSYGGFRAKFGFRRGSKN